MCSSRYAAAPSSCERASSARSRSTPCSRSASGSAAPSLSWRCRSSSWSAIEPAAAEEPKSERPKRAPSSSAQLTRRTVTAGVPSSARRRSTSTPATTFREPSSQPPFGTESMWPPSSTARMESPRSVNHWFPAASIVSSTGTPSKRSRSHPRDRSHVSVHATRCAPSSSPVSSASSRSSATVREGSSGTRRRYRLAPAMSVLIKNGRIVTAADDYVADLYVEDETVTLIGESLDRPADKVIDASGKYLLPGCVDPHTHLDMPFGGTVTIDDFESGQASAAFGGTTTHVDFAIQPQGATFAETLELWHAKR